MKKWILLSLTLLLIGCQNTVDDNISEMPKQIKAPISVEITEVSKSSFEEGLSTILYTSEDGLDVTADLYLINETSPTFILFHQAGWSRGEYIYIAKRFNDMGYNAMAVDLRSGMSINGIQNETAKRASENRFPRNHIDAALDVKASIQYAIDHFDTDIYLLGSSYSASLILVTSEEYSGYVDGLFAFSPGEYFTYYGKSIASISENLSIPTFITSASDETEEWEKIFEQVGSDDKFAFYPEGFGRHGASSLWDSTKEHTEFWAAMKMFLETIEKDAN